MSKAKPQALVPQSLSLALLDRLVALTTLVLVLPVTLVIAAAIVAESGLPVFFTQERLGLRGQRFRMLKFRKFPSSVGRDTLPLTMANDARLTRVGKFLERSKLDELPQLWNVVRGDMAIVGPRPEVPEFEACFAGPFRRVLDYRPGIFGPSQAMFRAEGTLYPQRQDPAQFYRETLFPAKAALDLEYYPSRTVLKDLGWVLRGALAVCGSGHAAQAGLAARLNAGGPARGGDGA